MTRTAFVLSTLAALCAVPVLAQQGPPSPAPELGKLKMFEGSWEGSGTATMAPGQPPTKWTSQSTCQWVMGGFFLQEDLTIQFDGGMPPLQFREYTGWDAENHRYASVVVSNKGEGELATLTFPADDTLVSLTRGIHDGKPYAKREVTKFTKDAATFTITMLPDQGPAVDIVTGDLKRIAKAKPAALEAALAMATAQPQIARIARTAGEYEVTGEMTMMPGTPALKIHGRDSLRTLFGGAVLQQVTHGDPTGAFPAYESHCYFTWNPADACYDALFVSNMGEIGSMQARFEGDALVGTTSGLSMGKSSAMRSIWNLDKDGRLTKVVCHACMGDAAPMQCFSATYVPAR
ncbi:MAG TPA: DUF1579 family protein [Planctomycetota bacterium]|nr:DUF1579 family protein [Planctomycetota bacterium]